MSLKEREKQKLREKLQKKRERKKQRLEERLQKEKVRIREVTLRLDTEKSRVLNLLSKYLTQNPEVYGMIKRSEDGGKEFECGNVHFLTKGTLLTSLILFPIIPLGQIYLIQSLSLSKANFYISLSDIEVRENKYEMTSSPH